MMYNVKGRVMATYKNPWHKLMKPEYGPEYYATDVLPKHYKEYSIYRRITNVYDIVKDNVCISQRAGLHGAMRFIDELTKENTK